MACSNHTCSVIFNGRPVSCSFFLENLVLKPEVLQINLNLIQRYIAISKFWIQCLFFQKHFHAHFLGQIWSPIVTFSKLLEIWYRGTLLYAYYNSSFYFSKILVTDVFLGNLIPWSRFFQVDWNFVEGQIDICLFNFNVYFFKIFAIYIFWANLVSKSEVLQVNWNLIYGYIGTCLKF